MSRASLPLLQAVTSIVRGAYQTHRVRVRQFGRLPLRRGATVLIANHQHEDESEIIIERTYLQGPWHRKVQVIGSRRLFERGFFAWRLPFSAPLTRRWNLSALFEGEGFLPLENDLSSRPLASIADELRARHGDLPLEAVLKPAARAGLETARTLADLDGADLFLRTRTFVKLGHIEDPYRRELLDALRQRVEDDLVAIVETVRAGATLYITPEGTYSVDGRMHPLRGIVERVAPVADVWLCGIAFDPLRGRRLSLLYRVTRPADPSDLQRSLAAARPITASALVASALLAAGPGAAPYDVVADVRARLAALPASCFVDPEVGRDPVGTVREALRVGAARGWLAIDGARYVLRAERRDARFPQIADVLDYQRAFLDETIAAARALETGAA